MQQSELRPFIGLYVILIIILLFTFSLKTWLLGGHEAIQLKPASGLSGAVSQGLFQSDTSTSVPQPGSDYTLASTVYLQANEWAVVNMKPVGQSADTGILLLRKVGDAYQLVLGPGTSFTNEQVKNLPAIVTNYLAKDGALIYEPSNG